MDEQNTTENKIDSEKNETLKTQDAKSDFEMGIGNGIDADVNQDGSATKAVVPASISNSISAKEVAKKNAKKKKPEKILQRKKLPRIYKRKYTEKKLKKKILKRLFVEDDRKFVESIFALDEATGKMLVPMDATFPKKDVVRLKRLAKEIKKQKGVVKFMPLIAVAAFVFLVIATVATFKNVIVKKVIVSGMQAVFKAKTDIAKVDLRIFGGSLTISGLEQASRSKPMKNLFEIGTLRLDYNLTDALRKKIHIEDVSVADIDWNTDRTTSGELSAKELQPSPALALIQAKSTKLVEDVRQKLLDTFAEYNPVNIVENLQENLQSPHVGEDVYKSVEEKVQKWMDKPEQVQIVIENFATSVQDVVNYDWGGIKDVQRLREALTTVNAAINQSKTIRSEVESILQQVQTDAKDVQLYAKQVQNAIEADKALIETQVNKISDLRTHGIQGIINDMLSTSIYSLAGQYYPYVEQGIKYAQELKAKQASAPPKKEKQKKKSVVARAAGRDVYWKADRIPTFLMEKVYTSGPGFFADLRDVSSDMDKWGKPAVFDGALSVLGHNHKAGVVVDTRDAADSLVAVDYSGDNWPIGVSFPEFGFSSNSVIRAKVTASPDGSFSVGGAIDMVQVKFDTAEFEPEILYTLYQKALATLDEISLGFTFRHTTDGDISLSLDTDADKKFLPKLLELFKAETRALVIETKERLFDELEKYTGDVTAKITEFTGIEVDMRNLSVNMDGVQAKLDEVQAKLTKQIADQASGALQSAINDNLPSEIKNSPLGDVIDKATGSEGMENVLNKGMDGLRGLFKR